MKQLPFEAIIFDHDGTLVDTEIDDFLACKKLCEEHNQSLSIEEWATYVVGRRGSTVAG